MKSVLILNGETRGTLGAVRALGKKGIQVIVGSHSPLAPALHSKYCKKSFLHKPIQTNRIQAHTQIMRAVRKHKPTILMPFCSDSTDLILSNLKEYQKHTTIIPLPPYKVFKIFNDKSKTAIFLKKQNIDTPKTFFTLGSALKNDTYPYLIKPRVSDSGQGIVKVHSPKQLIRSYENINNPNKNPIIQEYLSGTLYTVYVLFDKGKHIASMVKKMLRSYPAPFGPVVAYKSIVHEPVRNCAINMFKKLNWHGPANVHYIIKEGKPKLIEINPRLWGTMEFSVQSGINFPYKLYQMALNETVDPQTDYRTNITFSWLLFGDLVQIAKQLNLQAAHTLFRKNTITNFDRTDMWPHIVHTAALLKGKIV